MLFRIKMIRWNKKDLLFFCTWGFSLILIVSLLYVYKPDFLQVLDNKIYDAFLRSAYSREQPLAPLIVSIDERSLTEFGQWPWPRYRISLLLEKIRQLGASSIGLDMVFADPDRTSLDIFKNDILRDLKIDLPLTDLPTMLRDNDKFLADTLSRGPFVLGYMFVFADQKSHSQQDLLHPLNALVITDSGNAPDYSALFSASAVVCNLPELSKAVQSSGFFNYAPDLDAILRRVPLLIHHNGKLYPSLSLATLLLAEKITKISLRFQSTGKLSLHLSDTVIPLDDRGNLLINYRGPKNAFPSFSAGDVLNGHVPQDAFKGKIVLVGASAAGMNDYRATPLDSLLPGIEVHASVIDNILRGDFLARPGWADGIEWFLVLTFGVFSTFFLTRLHAGWSLIVLLFCVAAIWQGFLVVFQTHRLFISPLYPLIVLFGNFSILNLLKYWREEKLIRKMEMDISIAQELTIQCLASLAETRDTETGSHIFRTQYYVKILSEYLAKHLRFRHFLNDETIEILYKSAPLHDIGKVGIPDSILLKKGKLTADEFEEMKRHTLIGRNVINNAEAQLGTKHSDNLYLNSAKNVAYTHHEKWDGTGYPLGLKGDEIPIPGRLMAIADVYDALRTRRVYKEPLSHEKVIETIVEGKGKHFDPDIVDAFLELENLFRQIASKFADPEK